MALSHLRNGRAFLLLQPHQDKKKRKNISFKARFLNMQLQRGPKMQVLLIL